LTALSGCGSSSSSSSSEEVGASCFAADAGVEATDCGSLQCLCIEGSIPGVCSQTCTKDADCASFGDGMSCATEFCPGVSVCLRNYTKSTGP
jgi:hypothetical protein